MDKPFYIYRHIRPDRNEVFYVGRGMVYKRSSGTRRAFDVKRRNYIWRGIVDRNGGAFTVEIAAWTETLDEILEMERREIARHGKIIDGTGTLCNLTDGGDGSLGLKHSDKSRAQMSAQRKADPWRQSFIRSEEFKSARRVAMAGFQGSMKGKRHTNAARKLFSQQRSRGLNVNARTVIDVTTGRTFGCVSDAAEAVGIAKATLYKALSGERLNATVIIYLTNHKSFVSFGLSRDRAKIERATLSGRPSFSVALTDRQTRNCPEL